MLKNKVIAVTGAASGIGKATAALLKQQGARVIGVDRNPADGVDEFFQVDLSQRASIDALVEQLPDNIDGLANIAGVPSTLPPAVILSINLVGLKYFTEQVVSKLNDGASIVNLTSLAGNQWQDHIPLIKEALTLGFDDVADFVGSHDITDGNQGYSLSKEAVITWGMANRWTWIDRKIRMNSVSPGPVNTPILDDFIATLGERVEQDMQLVERPGEAGDIAPVVAFLLSDGAAWIRGANIPVDGGIYQHILLNKAGY